VLVASQYWVELEENQEEAKLRAFFHTSQVELRVATTVVAVLAKLHWALRVVPGTISKSQLLSSAGTQAKGV